MSFAGDKHLTFEADLLSILTFGFYLRFSCLDMLLLLVGSLWAQGTFARETACMKKDKFFRTWITLWSLRIVRFFLAAANKCEKHLIKS